MSPAPVRASAAASLLARSGWTSRAAAAEVALIRAKAIEGLGWEDIAVQCDLPVMFVRFALHEARLFRRERAPSLAVAETSLRLHAALRDADRLAGRPACLSGRSPRARTLPDCGGAETSPRAFCEG